VFVDDAASVVITPVDAGSIAYGQSETMMRIVALVFAILGGLGALGVGLLFLLGTSMAKDSPT